MNYSYWEAKAYLKPFDLIIVGGGIVGLSTGLAFRDLHPEARILILERGLLPDGASTRNAGFACFGSAGEILDDLQKQDKEHVFETIRMRFEGLQLLRQRIGDKNLAYEPLGGYEIFETAQVLDEVLQALPDLNQLLKPLTGEDCFERIQKNHFQLGPHAGMIHNRFEGQLDTGKMIHHLRKLAVSKDIELLSGMQVTALQTTNQQVLLKTAFAEFKCSICVVATNAFASELLQLQDVVPGRAQVLVTEPIPNLKLQGSFHADRGYYYFRNIDGRILLGGGRNLDPAGEQTFENGLTTVIQESLERLLTDLILPGQTFKIERRWSGIMGLGSEKRPIIAPVQNRVIAAVRMGGMGVAIGSLVGKHAAQMASQC